MRQTAQSHSKQARNFASDPARTAGRHQSFAPGGHLVQLAAMMNGSPRVQALAQLKDDLQQSSRVQTLASLSAEIRRGAPSRLRAVAVSDDPGLEHEAHAMRAKATAAQREPIAGDAKSTAAMETTRMPVQLGKDKKKQATQEAAQEEKWKKEIVAKGFAPEQVEIAGMGTSNADITAQDEQRLWLFEVKGSNQWKSAENFAHKGNTPAKQLARKLFGNLNKTLKIKTSGGNFEEVKLETALEIPEYYRGVREQFLLGVSNIDVDETPLLALQVNPNEEEGQKFDRTKGAALPLDLTNIFNYLLRLVEFMDAETEKEYGAHKSDVESVEEDWKNWPYDARSFFVENPEHLVAIEAAYTFARRKGSAHKPHISELETLGDEIEFRFIPVVRDLTHVAQFRRGPGVADRSDEAGVIRQRSHQTGAPGGPLAQLAAMRNQSPRVREQFAPADEFHGSESRSIAQKKGALTQGVFTHKKKTYNEQNAAEAEKIKIFKVKSVDLRRLAESERDFGEIANAEDVQAALEQIGEGETRKEPSLAEKHKEEQIAPYLELIDHLAGEGGAGKDLKGGHLLTEMKNKYPGLRISGTPSNTGPWEGWWTDGVSAPKWSSFFPANWTKEDLISQLRKSALVQKQLYLPDDIRVTKTGETFYPWVDQTLPKPDIENMVSPL